jgi:acetyl-CoA C-acetyltransferase
VTDAYIVDAIRTPGGRRGGGLSGIHSADLAAHVLNALIERTGIDPQRVDDVIMGCVTQSGAQAANVARTAWLSAGLPEEVPGTTIDRQCGSAQQSAHFAAQGVMSVVYDMAIAGGVENMSMAPMGSAISDAVAAGRPTPTSGAGWLSRFGTEDITQFNGAQKIAEKWDLSRPQLEEFALESHRRAARAWDEGRFDREVVAVGEVRRDEGVRADTTLEKMASLQSLPGCPLLTAAVASQICDGASAMLIASEAALDAHRLKPRARFHTMSVTGSDPVLMLTGPIAATKKVLDRAGLSLDDIDLFEVNEAFAPVVLAWSQETGAPLERTNVNGGAIALGHPLGATGVKLLATLLCELERTGGRYGLLTMCEGGGMANATVIERIA